MNNYGGIVTRPVMVNKQGTEREAVFHGFGLDFEELNDGVGSYTVAIVEMPDGTVELVPVDLVQFINPATTTTEEP